MQFTLEWLPCGLINSKEVKSSWQSLNPCVIHSMCVSSSCDLVHCIGGIAVLPGLTWGAIKKEWHLKYDLCNRTTKSCRLPHNHGLHKCEQGLNTMWSRHCLGSLRASRAYWQHTEAWPNERFLHPHSLAQMGQSVALFSSHHIKSADDPASVWPPLLSTCALHVTNKAHVLPH